MHIYAELLSLALVLLLVIIALNSHKGPRAVALRRDIHSIILLTSLQQSIPLSYERLQSLINEHGVVSKRYETPGGT